MEYIIVTQMDAPDFGVANVNGKDSIVVGVSLTFTFLDKDGKPPLATVVIGGLITSTLLTLLILPTLYGWFEREPVESAD